MDEAYQVSTKVFIPSGDVPFYYIPTNVISLNTVDFTECDPMLRITTLWFSESVLPLSETDDVVHNVFLNAQCMRYCDVIHIAQYKIGSKYLICFKMKPTNPTSNLETWKAWESTRPVTNTDCLIIVNGALHLIVSKICFMDKIRYMSVPSIPHFFFLPGTLTRMYIYPQWIPQYILLWNSIYLSHLPTQIIRQVG